MNNDKRTILLVEDDSIIAFATKLSLESMGYRAFAAASGEEAIAVAAGSALIDMILMDIDLGKGIDGIEAARTILEGRDVPIVFLSSHGEQDMVQKTDSVTSYGYVMKNSNMITLGESIKMALRLFEANRKLLQNRELLENVIDTFPGFVVWKDTDSVFMGCNANFAKRSGFNSSAEIIGKRDSDLPFTQEEVEGFLEDDRSVMDSCVPKRHFKEREHIAGGEEIVLDTCKFPLFDGKGKVVGLLAVARDITAPCAVDSFRRNNASSSP